MDPTSPISDPRLGDRDRGPGSETSLVDVVDQALVRLDGLRDRPRLSSAITAAVVFAIAVGWVLTEWRHVDPIDDDIPRVGQVQAVGPGIDEPVDGGGSSPDSGANPTGQGGSASAANLSSSSAGSDQSTSVPAIEPVVVHVSGAVKIEGLVELIPGSRLADAVAAAGGPTAAADVHRLNLATPVVDGMHVRVPELGEEGADASLPLVETATVSPASGDGVHDRAEPAAVNVNTAGASELERLPGVGPAIAAAIIAWRDDNGPFSSTDDLLSVPGIGPAKLAAIEDQVAL